MNKPINTSAALVACNQVNDSFKSINASIELKMGMRLPNKAVRTAPSLSIAAFQHKKEITEVPRPKYAIMPQSFQLLITTPPCCNSNKLKGSSSKVPKLKIVNRKTIGEMPAGFLRTSKL